MLQGGDGSTSSARVHADYPVDIAWDGILVDDLGLDDVGHPSDLVARFARCWRPCGPRPGESPPLGWRPKSASSSASRTLRDYFRRPTGFFADHLARYSKSRRQAPIYWPLSTASGSYTLWIYYPRLSDDLLYRAVTDYLDPRLAEVERRIAEIDGQLSAPIARDAAQLRGQLDELRSFRGELTDLRAELLRVAALPYRPNLDDGVLISAAPLHGLFRLPKWRADLNACWEKLAAGDYDWAHLAFAIWPDRVREACRRDRSIAIAHGLEDLYAGPTQGVARSRSRRVRAGEDDTP